MKRLNARSKGFFDSLEGELRDEGAGRRLTETVGGIISEVGSRGDSAVVEFTETFDHVRLAPSDFQVPEESLSGALRSLSAGDRRAIREAISCVKDYNRRTRPEDWTDRNPHGAVVGESHYPIRRVGVYVPGGRAPLVSSAVMTVTLASIAGVPEIAVFTPPGPEGRVAAGTLAAIKLAGATEVFRIGGVQAIAAMAYGTETVRPVDKIFGPGNAYVVEAKRQVFGRVGVDLLPGPSEVMIIADETARPDWVAADLLSQAEHGHGGKIFLVSPESGLIKSVETELRRQTPGLTHREVISETLAEHTYAIRVRDLEQAAEVANFVAPEHLELHVDRSWLQKYRRLITTAGAVLEGAYTPTVLGDFTAGPSHVLPTGFSGRFFSGLRVSDFMRRTSRLRYDRRSLRKALPVVEAFSRLENLDAHGASASIRLRKSD